MQIDLREELLYTNEEDTNDQTGEPGGSGLGDSPYL